MSSIGENRVARRAPDRPRRSGRVILYELGGSGFPNSRGRCRIPRSSKCSADLQAKVHRKSSLLPLETAEVGQWEELRLFPGWERANVIWCG